MDILPDVLKPGLNLIFCGTAAGTKSAEVKCYYASPGNKFWKTLYQVGLTPRQLTPREFPQVLHYGIGLTDLNKLSFGPDSTLKFSLEDRSLLRAKFNRFQPKVIAFTSKTAAREFFGKSMPFGRQGELLGVSHVFVLPSTSGLACRTWDEKFWQELAVFVWDGV